MYYKVIENGYIVLIGVNCGGTQITDEEYNKIMNTIKSKPKAREGYDYKLKSDLTWEEYKLPIVLEGDE